jgi:hypothetical protein
MNQSWIDEFEKEINMTNECGMELIILGDKRKWLVRSKIGTFVSIICSG